MAAKRKTLEDELSAFAAVVADPRSDASRKILISGLQSARARVVARAAGLIQQRQLDGFEPALLEALPRFMEDGAKTDPNCLAKHAILEALDHVEHAETDIFLSAVTYTQEEKAYGGPIETAGNVRARCLFALARLAYPDLTLVAAKALADAQAQVRAAAADALAHFGVRHGAALLLLKLAEPDEDPMVTLSCMTALVTLAPDVALTYLAPLLRTGTPDSREVAALALGQSNRSDAAELLINTLTTCATTKQRDPLLRALGLHRSDRAIDTLLNVVSEGSPDDAKAALFALAPRRFEPGLRARAETAVSKNAKVDLRAVLVDAFRP